MCVCVYVCVCVCVQLQSITAVLSGRVSLPMGYGKLLCYVIRSWAFDELRNTNKTSIVVGLVVMPLVSLTNAVIR